MKIVARLSMFQVYPIARIVFRSIVSEYSCNAVQNGSEVGKSLSSERVRFDIHGNRDCVAIKN